jgi:alpha-L-rhamnosidase
MGTIGAALGHSADAAVYTQQAVLAKVAYHARFWDDVHSCYNDKGKLGKRGPCTQTGYVMPLVIGAVPAGLRVQVAAALATDITKGEHGHLNVGIVGTTFVLDALTAEGYADVALQLLMRDDYPSFGYMIQQQATTLWEAWEGTPTKQVSSRNHIMFGGNVGTWFATAVAGLDTLSNATSSGWKDILIAPTAAALLTLPHAEASQQTRFGDARVAWAIVQGSSSKTASKTVSINVTIPPGSNAELFLPLLSCASTQGTCVQVQEAGQAVWKGGHFIPHAGFHSGRTTIRNNRTTLALAVGSGNYTVLATL